MAIWVWLKIKQEGLRRFWSMFPPTRVPFWHRFFEPQPYGCFSQLDSDRFLQVGSFLLVSLAPWQMEPTLAL